MRRALEGLEGVKKAEVSFSQEEAVVYYEQGKASIDEMMSAVGNAGFRATKKQRP